MNDSDNSVEEVTGDSNEAVQYHVALKPGDVADTVLLPGDPDRIDDIASIWDHAEEIAFHREFRTITGELDGIRLSATSTGIGSPSAAIALEELARLRADTFIRVGSCGTIREDISLGDLVISAAAIRGEGTSDEYTREDYPASAHYLVVSALIQAAEELGYDYHVGVTMSTDSFYPGQARPGFGAYEWREKEGFFEELRKLNVINIEMETSALLTISQIYGLRAGAICSVYANRRTGEFETIGDSRSAAVASRAAVILQEMDEKVEESTASHWHPGLEAG